MIKHLTPKSDEDIMKYLKSLDPYQRLLEAVKNDLPLLVEEILDNEACMKMYINDSLFIQESFVWAIVRKNKEIVTLFLEKGIKPENALSEFGMFRMNEILQKK